MLLLLRLRSVLNVFCISKRIDLFRVDGNISRLTFGNGDREIHSVLDSQNLSQLFVRLQLLSSLGPSSQLLLKADLEQF
jgi:hypothetical protein